MLEMYLFIIVFKIRSVHKISPVFGSAAFQLYDFGWMFWGFLQKLLTIFC